jgi:hypothetical protein
MTALPRPTQELSIAHFEVAHDDAEDMVIEPCARHPVKLASPVVQQSDLPGEVLDPIDDRAPVNVDHIEAVEREAVARRGEHLVTTAEVVADLVAVDGQE